MKSKKTGLAALENLNVRTYAKTEKRKVGDAVDDVVAEKLAKCQSPNDMAALGAEYGLDGDEIADRAKKAPNFGQFRMTLGNLCRGSIKRQEAAKTLGLTLAITDCGDKKLYRGKMSEFRKSLRPVKDGSKVKGGKGKKPVAKSKGGIKTIENDGSITDENGKTVRGAPSKSEAANRGRGKSSARAKAKDGVEQESGNAGGDASLADAVAEANA
jgi:hypothetical protein